MKHRFYSLSSTLPLALLLATAMAMPAQAADKKKDGPDEIIVTAQKRDERLVDVPSSISVFNDAAIEQTGVTQLSAIADYLPNVEITDGANFNSAVTIRGVGANSRNIGFDTRVGVYVDGIYVGQSPAINQELLDLQQVEILRGPQGTLFGKDTVAGAVNLITKKPSQNFEASFDANIGNMEYTEFQGMVNIPLGEKAAVKVSAAQVNRDGYIYNTVTQNNIFTRDETSYRVQFRATPNEKLEINASFDGLNSSHTFLLGEPATDMLGLFPVALDRVVSETVDPNEKRDIYGGAFNVDYHMENGYTMKSLTGYRDTKAHYNSETDHSAADIIYIIYDDKYQQFSEELQLVSPDFKRGNFVAGLYYYNQKGVTNRDVVLGQDFITGFIAPFVAPGVAHLFGFDPANLSAAQLDFINSALGFGPPGATVTNHGEVTTNSYAAYFNANYDLTERLRLNVGARYTIADKDVNWTLDGRNSGIFNIGSTNVPVGGTQAPTPLINTREDKAFDPTVSLIFKLNEESNVYAKYASGFKSGGFNLDYINANELAANTGLEFGKETVDSFEAGYKANYGRFALNIAAFYSKYSDYQVNQFVDLGGGSTAIRITNAAKVDTKGIEFDGQLRLMENLTLTATAGILDASFASFPGGGTAGSDATGNKLPFAPDFSASLGFVYYHNIPSLDGRMMIRGDYTHRSGLYTGVENTMTSAPSLAPTSEFQFGYVESSDRLNGRIGFIHNQGKYEVYLWGLNLADDLQYTTDLRDFFNTKVRFPGIGRTYGVEVKVRF